MKHSTFLIVGWNIFTETVPCSVGYDSWNKIPLKDAHKYKKLVQVCRASCMDSGCYCGYFPIHARASILKCEFATRKEQKCCWVCTLPWTSSSFKNYSWCKDNLIISATSEISYLLPWTMFVNLIFLLILSILTCFSFFKNPDDKIDWHNYTLIYAEKRRRGKLTSSVIDDGSDCTYQLTGPFSNASGFG